jgi:four helix bundle protein
MSQIAEQLKARSMRFSLQVCRLLRHLPDFEPGPTIRYQLARSATGMAFNYRASCRARSHAEFTAKMGLVAEEADETLGWLEFVEAGNFVPRSELACLLSEARELTAIFSASVGTARYNDRSRRNRGRGTNDPHG